MLFSFIVEAGFDDVTGVHPYYESINNFYEQSYIDGYSDGTFKPNKTVNRAEFVKILIEYLDYYPESTNCFPDVKEDWYAPYVCTAKKMGWIEGYPDGYFHPEREINLVEASKIIVVALGLDFSDSTGGTWFAPYINALAKKESLPPSLNGFEHFVNRGEIVEMLYRSDVIEYYYSHTYLTLEQIGKISSQKEKLLKKFELVYELPASLEELSNEIDYETFDIFTPMILDAAGGQTCYGRSCVFFWSPFTLFRDKNSVYCKASGGGDDVVNSLVVYSDADPETFHGYKDIIFDKDYIYSTDYSCISPIISLEGKKHLFGGRIFADDLNIYIYRHEYSYDEDKYFLDKIDGVDRESFEKVDAVHWAYSRLYRDNDNLYELIDVNYQTGEYEFNIVDLEIDLDTFQHVEGNFGIDPHSRHHFYQDKNNIYCMHYGWGDFADLVTISGLNFDEVKAYVDGINVVLYDSSKTILLDHEAEMILDVF